MLVTAEAASGKTIDVVVRAALVWLQRLSGEKTEMFTESWQFYGCLDLDGRKCFTDHIRIDNDKSYDLTLGFDFVGVLLYLKADSDPELILACYKLAILGKRPWTISAHPDPLSESEQALIDSRKIGMAQDAGVIDPDELRARQARR